MNRNKEYRLKRKNQRKDYIIQNKNIKLKTMYYQNKNKKEKIEKLEKENKQLKEVIEKVNNELITLIQIIMEQPSENAVDDIWLLNRLESISKILDKGVKDE